MTLMYDYDMALTFYVDIATYVPFDSSYNGKP
jgi:hypothetical protein